MMNLPNLLTMARMGMIPIFVGLYYSGWYAWALIVYLMAGATDILDGYLARKRNQVTSFGKLMDPLADKLMTLSMVFCLADTGYLPWWVMIALMIKEIFMVLGGAALLRGVKGRRIVVMANWAGKTATAMLIAAVVLVFPWHTWETVRAIGRIFMYVAVAFSLFAMGNYAYGYVKKLSEGKES